jgi:hypothetical protein
MDPQSGMFPGKIISLVQEHAFWELWGGHDAFFWSELLAANANPFAKGISADCPHPHAE